MPRQIGSLQRRRRPTVLVPTTLLVASGDDARERRCKADSHLRHCTLVTSHCDPRHTACFTDFHCEETMTQSNPFYVTSASAMLLGCWLLSQALHLQAGQLKGLLLLMLVLQVYEALLVGLGAYLVRSKRAPRDGLVVLVIESMFLMDTTLLSAECVTTDLSVGTLAALTAAALAVLKLLCVRRAAPDLLSRKLALALGLHAAVILALPVAAAHLAGARLLSPV